MQKNEGKKRFKKERERTGKAEIFKCEIKDQETCSLCSYLSPKVLKDQNTEL